MTTVASRIEARGRRAQASARNRCAASASPLQVVLVACRPSLRRCAAIAVPKRSSKRSSSSGCARCRCSIRGSTPSGTAWIRQTTSTCPRRFGSIVTRDWPRSISITGIGTNPSAAMALRRPLPGGPIMTDHDRQGRARARYRRYPGSCRSGTGKEVGPVITATRCRHSVSEGALRWETPRWIGVSVFLSGQERGLVAARIPLRSHRRDVFLAGGDEVAIHCAAGRQCPACGTSDRPSASTASIRSRHGNARAPRARARSGRHRPHLHASGSPAALHPPRSSRRDNVTTVATRTYGADPGCGRACQ